MGSGMFGNHGDETHEELAVLDRAGRLQIPADYINALGLKDKNKIKVELDGDRVVLYAPRDNNDKKNDKAG